MIYDAFQEKAISFIKEGHSVIVSAPTGAGKTAIAEYVIADCMRRGEKVIYTAPIKALSNQKYRDFRSEGDAKVGILTGDVSLNSGAPVLIMTTEIFRNKILEQASSLRDYSWIIFDEIHYLDDYERGSVWEESLIFLPDHMKFLGLSATIPNIDELKDWLESVHRHPVKVVKETRRPVPLHFFYQCQGRVYDDINEMANKGFRTPRYPHLSGRRLPPFVHLKANKPNDLIADLHQRKQLPCIYFVFSRRMSESLAQELGGLNFLEPEEAAEITDLFDQLCARFELTSEPSAHQIRPLIKRGIAYHHAGMLPTLKEVVEQLFTSRLLKVIFTTETFALGINMPARSVIFDELRKFYGRSFSTLKTRDFYQMAGRAGRRSIDTEGFVYCRVNPHDISPPEIRNIIFGAPEKVRSQFDASFATILNLYQAFGEKLVDIYPRSFHYFQTSKALRKKALYLMKGKVDILKELGCIQGGRLTEKGIFASKVYGYELILAELFERGILERLSLAQWGCLSLAIVYEPRKGMAKPKLNKMAHDLEAESQKIILHINRLEKTVGLRTISKGCHFHLSAAAEAWIKQASFNDMLKHTEADEGEVVRYFRMALQVLRQILEGPVSDKTRATLYQLQNLINRDVIDSEKQLRG